MGSQTVIFSLGNEEYGIFIESVQEITRLSETETHPIPQAPAYVKGLISIRGQAIPLINMHEKFGIKPGKETEYAIIIEINNNLVGFAVEEVKEVKTLDNIFPPPPIVSASFISGIVNLPERIIILIDPALILEEADIIDISALIG